MSDASLSASTPQTGEAGFGDYFALLKPRVMTLVVFTAFVGLYAAPGAVHPVVGFAAILFIAVGGGASGALNMWWDADIDRVMKRTRNRPIPSGRITGSEAFGFGMTLAGFAVIMLGLATNLFAAALLAFTIFFYVVIYSMWLKRWTPQNIVIGGAAGAFPPMIGWAAVTGGVSLESVLMFALIFMWTPPHFWALALFKSGDYERAGIPMLPNVAGHAATKKQIFIYALLLAASGILPVVAGFASFAFGAVAAILGVGFIWYSWQVLRMPESDMSMKPAKALFGYSLLYLFVLFTALLADRLLASLGLVS